MLSIIIPTFNEEKAIEETIRQFDDLKIPHEILISDTLSTDQTVVIAEACRCVVLTTPPGSMRGIARGRNAGAAAAKGEFLVFLDSGTSVPDPNKFFANALDRFAREPRLAGLSCRIEVDPKFRTWSDWLIWGGMNAYYALLNNFFNFGIAAGKFQMIKAESFNAVHGFNEKLAAAEDMEFFTRLSKIGKTRIAWNLVVYHSGRRFHQSGPWKTLYRWMKNALSLWLFKKSADKEWEAVR